MKKILLTSYLTFLTCLVFSQVSYKQIRIPLDNLNGVPYEKLEGGYHIGGFEVDENNCLYFLGGSKAILAVFKQNTLVYKKQYKEFKSGNLYIQNHKLYSFDCLYEPSYKRYKNNLIVLDQANGTIYKIYDQIIKRPVNSYRFLDSYLFIETQGEIKTSNDLIFIKYDLSGSLVKQINNSYDLATRFFPKSYSDEGGVNFLGIWDNYHLYQSYNDLGKIKFWALDTQGSQKPLKTIDTKILGKSFIETPNEFIKLRNGYIYIVGYERSDVLITKISIKDLF